MKLIMKIGFFTDGFLPQPNGVATSVFSSARALEKMGHEVFIVAPKYPGYKDELNVFRLTSVKVMSKPELRLALHLPDKPFMRLLRMDFDIIHVHSGGPVTLLGLEIAKAKNIPIVATYHTLWNRYTHYFMKGKVIKPKMMEQATRLFCNRCDYLIAPTSLVKEELEKYGIKRPISIIPNGIDIEKFNIKKTEVFINKYKIPNENNILLSVARLGEEKSIDFLLRSFKRVIEKNPKTTFVLVGDGPEKKKLIEEAKKLGIEKNTIFTGFMDSDKLPDVYACADIFLFSSQTETQGMVILEALASGVPVVCVKDKVFEDVVQDGANGFLLDKDEDIFAQKITELLNNSEKRSELGRNAKKMTTSFSVESSSNALEELYENVLEIRKRESMERIMSANKSYEELFLTLLSFWTTIFSLRIISIISSQSTYPSFSFGQTSFPHILVGLGLFFFFLPFVFKKNALNFFSLIILGISFGLIMDDFWVFAMGTHSSYLDYWARGNLVLISLSGVIPVLFVRFIKKNRPDFFVGPPNKIHSNPDNPKISVVVPAYNEEAFISRTLSSLVNQTYKNFEIIVVDNNSKDRTGEIAAEFGARVIVEHKKGVAFARQAGFFAASGQIIATTDADTIVPENWLEEIARAYDSEDVVGFGGLNRLYSGPVGSRAAGRYLSSAFWIIDKILSGGWNLLGSNLSVRKSAFEKIGGFNTDLTLGEDVDLSQRLKNVGKIKLDTNFLVYSSGRRFRHGLLLGVITYAPSWFMRVVFKQDKFLTFPTIRSSESSLFSKFSFLPLFLCIFSLAILFYSVNPQILSPRPLHFVNVVLEEAQRLGEAFSL